MYEIVIHEVSIMNLDMIKMSDMNVIKHLEMKNNMKIETITKITSLRRKSKSYNYDNKVKLHHFIIIYTNDSYTANKCITNDFYIDYIPHTIEKFMSQYQITQCFNCYDYEYHAINCK